MKKNLTLNALMILATLISTLSVSGMEQQAVTQADKACQFLEEMMDRYHRVVYVYDDAGSAGNRFAERAKICQSGDESLVPSMAEDCEEQPFSGRTCIRCEFKAEKATWGGWSFMNGVFVQGEEGPSLNWGTHPNAGENLKGATRLTFRARGQVGGEKVQFYCFGIGRDDFSGAPRAEYPESCRKMQTKYITLTKEWKEYTIELSGCDLTNVVQGFGWTTKSTINRYKDITFFLDDIQYNQSRLGHSRLLTSYETQRCANDADLVLANTAYVYDNALAILTFLASGDTRRARLVANALVYAQEHDRSFDDGRIRNAYQGGDLRMAPGWMPTGKKDAVRMPGWFNKKSNTWCEDANAAGTSVGNLAWSMLALMTTYESTGDKKYMLSAMKMGKWIIQNCRDEQGAGGFTAGFEGWEPEQEKLTYKSTEHNIDLFAVFSRLYEMTERPIWKDNAEHALKFVKAMWDGRDGKFWTGTESDGVTIFREVVPLDTQAWALLALREEGSGFVKGLDYAEKNMRVSGGYDFNQDGDGVWFEGTAQMAAVYASLGRTSQTTEILSHIRSAQHASGGVFATDRAEVTTGFYTQGGDEWLYYQRLHVGATAWFALAEMNRNPFWMRGDAGMELASHSGRASNRMVD